MGFAYQKVIGFDLGHAHTTLAMITVEGKVLDVLRLGAKAEEVMTTAFKRVYLKDGSGSYTLQLGDRAMRRVRPGEELALAFKAPPPGDALYAKNMHDYFAAVLQMVQDQGHIESWDGYMIVVGCPSGWKPNVRDQYQRVLADPRFPTPLVVSESRAALLNAIGTTGVLTPEELSSAILTVDVGSSTVDFTIIHGGSHEEPLYTFGNELGGSFFDEQILEQAVTGHSNAQRLFEILADNPELKHILLYRCRKCKEEYFTNPEDYETETVVGFSEDLGDVVFDPNVDGSVMRNILAKPTKFGLPWDKAFESNLQNAKLAAQEKGYPIRVVVLTGGAARMPFVSDVVRKVFSEEDRVRTIFDLAPHASVARGLAIWGRGDVLVKSFRSEVGRLFEKEIPELVGLHQPALLDSLIPELADQVINMFVLPGLQQWRNREYGTTKELKDVLNKQAHAWMTSVDGKQFFIRIANVWWEHEVRDKFAELVNPICVAHDVPSGSLDIRDPYTLENFDAPDWRMPIPLEEMIRIVGYVIFWLIIWVLPLGGPLLAAFIALFFKGVVDSAIDEFMQHVDMPAWARKWVTDEKLRNIGLENRQKIVNTMTAKLANDHEFLQKLNKHLVSQLYDDVERKVQSVENRLYSGN